MNTLLKIILIISAAIVLILVLFFFLGRKRLKEQKSADEKIEKMIERGEYVIAKCMIKSDVIYHDRVSLGDEQKQHLQYLDGLVEKCNKNIVDKKIDEQAELGQYIITIIPEMEYTDFSFVLEYCNPDVNYNNEKGETPLITACKHGKIHIVRYLLDHRADINAVNSEGKSALAMACNTGNYELIKLLVKNGANVKHTDKSGKKILQQVSSDSTNFVKIVSFLTESGAGK